MTIFPNILFQIGSHYDNDVLRTKLDHLLKSEKYEGYWENNILYISKIYISRNKISTDFYLTLQKNLTERIISTRCELREPIELIFKIFIILLIIAEAVLIVLSIQNHSFNFNVTIPVVLGSIYYILVKNDYTTAVRDFKKDLIRVLK
jgi:hypothetical protein